GETDPLPTVTAKSTGTPLNGLPLESETLTMNGDASVLPTAPDTGGAVTERNAPGAARRGTLASGAHPDATTSSAMEARRVERMAMGGNVSAERGIRTWSFKFRLRVPCLSSTRR